MWGAGADLVYIGLNKVGRSGVSELSTSTYVQPLLSLLDTCFATDRPPIHRGTRYAVGLPGLQHAHHGNRTVPVVLLRSPVHEEPPVAQFERTAAFSTHTARVVRAFSHRTREVHYLDLVDATWDGVRRGALAHNDATHYSDDARAWMAQITLNWLRAHSAVKREGEDVNS